MHSSQNNFKGCQCSSASMTRKTIHLLISPRWELVLRNISLASLWWDSWLAFVKALRVWKAFFSQSLLVSSLSHWYTEKLGFAQAIDDYVAEIKQGWSWGWWAWPLLCAEVVCELLIRCPPGMRDESQLRQTPEANNTIVIHAWVSVSSANYSQSSNKQEQWKWRLLFPHCTLMLFLPRAELCNKSLFGNKLYAAVN